MTQNEVDKLNEQVSYAEGKVYWLDGRGWTSALFQRLYQLGWRMTNNHGLRTIKDAGGNTIVSGEIGAPNALVALAMAMR